MTSCLDEPFSSIVCGDYEENKLTNPSHVATPRWGRGANLMIQTDIFGYLYPEYKINKPIRLIELFSGVGTQAMALRDLGADFEYWKTCEWDYHAILSYATIHCGDDKNNYSSALNDFAFFVICFLKEWNEDHYTGREMAVVITNVASKVPYLPDDVVVLSTRTWKEN